MFTLCLVALAVLVTRIATLEDGDGAEDGCIEATQARVPLTFGFAAVEHATMKCVQNHKLWLYSGFSIKGVVARPSEDITHLCLVHETTRNLCEDPVGYILFELLDDCDTVPKGYTWLATVIVAGDFRHVYHKKVGLHCPQCGCRDEGFEVVQKCAVCGHVIA
jgi:hypothetical protein